MLFYADGYAGLRRFDRYRAAVLSRPKEMAHAVMLSVFVFYQQYAENKWVSDALVGMAASASGMVAGAAMKLLYNCKENTITPPVWIFGLVITFITVGVLKISMVYILPIVGIPLSFWAWYRFIKERSARS